jgi:hypothetical protein
MGGGDDIVRRRRTERTAAVLIRLSDLAWVDDLCDHYRRSGFAVEPVSQGVVDVSRADAPDAEQGRRELLMHLRVWRVLNPDAVAQTVG